jgi:hypothetical protein
MPVFPTSPRSMPGPAPATATTPAATAKHAATTIPGASAPTVTPAVTH